MEGPGGAVLLACPFSVDPPRAGRPPLRCVLPLPHEGVGLGHVPHHTCGCQPRHHQRDVCPPVGEGVDERWLCLFSVRTPVLRARSAQSLSTLTRAPCPTPTWRASSTSSCGVRQRGTPSRTGTSSPPPGVLRAAQAAPEPHRCRPPTLPAGRPALRRSVSAIRPAGGGACRRRRP
eukprot:3932496-Rhodomonas_salina.1